MKYTRMISEMWMRKMKKMKRMRKLEQERKITSEDKQNLVFPPIIFTNTGRV